MKKSARMLLVAAGRMPRRYESPRYDSSRYPPMEPLQNWYDTSIYGPENRFRDRRGREHYEDGRYAPQSNREHPESWRMEPRDYGDPWMERGRMPEIHDGGVRKMNPIGFAREPGSSDATMPQYQEMDRMPGNRARQGYADSSAMPRFDREMAEEWTSGMVNEDGTRGPHWNADQVRQVMAQHGMSGDPWKVYAVLNSVYSDYCKVFRKYGVGDKLDFYVDMAKAWLSDSDAVPDKAAAYFEYVVKH